MISFKDGFGVYPSSSSDLLVRGFGGFHRTIFEAEAVISGFENVIAADEAIDQYGSHLVGAILYSELQKFPWRDPCLFERLP
jgi:hypothetical protein